MFLAGINQYYSISLPEEVQCEIPTYLLPFRVHTCYI